VTPTDPALTVTGQTLVVVDMQTLTTSRGRPTFSIAAGTPSRFQSFQLVEGA